MLSVYRGLKPNPIFLWFFLLFFFPPLSTQAQEPSSQTSYTLNDFLSGTELDYYFTYFEDPSTELTLEEALNQNWQASKQHKMSFGYTNSVYWFRIIIKNNSDEHQDRLLNIDYPVIDYISAYSRVDDGEWALKEYGDKYSFYERDLNHRNFVIPIRFEKQSTMELIFRVQTTSSMQFPVSIWQPRDFFIHDQMQILILGVYYGLMIVMFLYNLFIFFSVRERSYLFYVLYVASISGFLASLQGLNFQLLWPEATNWNDKSIVFFLGCTVLFAVLFAKYFLEIKVIKHFDYALNTIAALSLLIIVASFFTPYHTMIQLLILLTIAHHVIVLVAGIIRWWQGCISARYYVIAWSTLLVGGFLMSLSKYNIIPSGILVDNIVQIGSALEVTLLSFALADRFNQEKRQRYEAQQMALEQEKIARRSKEEAFEQERNARIAQEKALQHEREAREAQSKALDIQKQATETLEQRVKERTEELETVNRRLELMSITDPLTNVRNRRYFDQSIQREMARAVRQRETICVLMIDIDFFKKINDTYGHQTGDEVLKLVASTIHKTVHRGTDLLARYGGEEFILVLPNTPIDGAAIVGKNICLNIEALDLTHLNPDLRVTVSIGIFGRQPDNTQDYESWTKYADEALYQAKESGRNRVVVYQQLQKA